ncbi:early nodulin-like protein 1 [Cocos nucifera]|uniref:Early nodulin-like protein 1 n=1 Tax=Cocos nucifera TaxID=13894 RepID=A0A8K0IA23_COCNU|nr:early nodulin-like protein 1 [Cocos nucifera]
MEALKSSAGFLLVLGVAIGLVSSSEAYNFYVGGRGGSWGLNPPEDYGRWAGRNRFQVNDTIVFKYKKGNDSVLVVKKEDYDSCNSNNPIQSFHDGNTVFKFDRSGPFYFISGTGDRCQKGEKLIIVVLAPRNKSPTQPPPSPAPPTPSPKSPTSSPAPSPSIHVPPPSPSPPGSSPSPGFSPSPSGAPSPGSPGSRPGGAPAPSPSQNSSTNSSSSSSSPVLSGVSFGLVALVLGTALIN